MPQTAAKKRHAPNGRRTPAAGFSLMEGIAVLGVMTLLLVMVGQIFITSYRIYYQQAARADGDTAAMLAARAISDVARGAVEVIDSQQINGTTYTSSSDELVLRLPTVNASGSLVAGEYDYVAFFRDPTDTDEIWSDTEIGTGSRRLSGQKRLMDHNTDLVFRYNSPTVGDASRVTAYLKSSRTVRDTTIDSEAWTSIYTRN